MGGGEGPLVGGEGSLVAGRLVSVSNAVMNIWSDAERGLSAMTVPTNEGVDRLLGRMMSSGDEGVRVCGDGMFAGAIVLIGREDGSEPG